jgi:hypothetical protein
VDKCGEMKCSEGLSNRASNIIRRYIDQVKFAAYMVFVYHILSYSFGYSFYNFIYGCVFCMFLLNCVNYEFYCYVHVLL